MTTGEVIELECAPRSVAGVRAVVPPGRVAEYFGRCLDEVYAAGRTGSIALDGQNIFIYHPRSDGNLTIDFCVGTPGPFDAIGDVTWRETPSGWAARSVHRGDYGTLGVTNRAIREWCREHHKTLAGPSWEVYGHWEPDPTKLVTEVYYLLEPIRVGG